MSILISIIVILVTWRTTLIYEQRIKKVEEDTESMFKALTGVPFTIIFQDGTERTYRIPTETEEY